MTKTLTKKISLELEGLDGNAFGLLGAFRRQAKHEDWTDEEIKIITDKARSGDYDNLLTVLSAYCR